MIFKNKLKRENLIALCFLAPSLVGFIIFFLAPFLVSIYYSFFDSLIRIVALISKLGRKSYSAYRSGSLSDIA